MLIPQVWVSLQFHHLLGVHGVTKMVLSTSDNIVLSAPLCWVTDEGLSGVVTGIGTETVSLRSYDNLKHKKIAGIRIGMPNGHWLSIEGQLVPSDTADHKMIIESATSKKTLQDLLNLVRKDQHIEICRSQDVESSDRFTGFSEIQFIPEALPEIDFSDLDTRVSFLGRRFSLPLLITGMTGGIEKGAEINRRLALAAQHFDIPMGIGSQRLALENEEFAPIFAVKKYAPKLFVIGNIGCSQLLEPNAVEMCQRAVDMVEADTLAVHINILQECVQVEGDRRFKGILHQLNQLCERLSVPVMVKEVGSGINPATARRLREAGVAAVDVGGRGGTSWGYIEGLRASSRETKALAESFRNWGIPTAYSVYAIRQQDPQLPLVATGGIRDGLTAAKAVALGASMVGIGLPLLRAALTSEEEPFHVLQSMERGFKTTMVLTGSQKLADLSSRWTLGHPYSSLLSARSQRFPEVPL